MNEQTQEALKLAIGELVLQKMSSGNSIPVSRCTITNTEIHALSNDVKKEAIAQPAQYSDIISDGGYDPRNKLAKPIQDAIDFLDGSYEAHKIRKALQEALESQDDLLTGTWIRYGDGDDTKRLALELDIAMNGIDSAAKSPALIDVLSQAVDYFKSGKKYHVLPIDDIEEHNESDSCKCNPLIETYELDKVIIHNSFDGRELNEQPLTRDWKETIDERIAKDDAFKQALAQPAQEPVSLGDFDRMTKAECVEYIDYLRKALDLVEFKEWQGLSDDKIKSFGKDFFDIDICLTGNLMNFARAIEQALKEKNS